jgi:hypothetical protein
MFNDHNSRKKLLFLRIHRRSHWSFGFVCERDWVEIRRWMFGGGSCDALTSANRDFRPSASYVDFENPPAVAKGNLLFSFSPSFSPKTTRNHGSHFSIHCYTRVVYLSYHARFLLPYESARDCGSEYCVFVRRGDGTCKHLLYSFIHRVILTSTLVPRQRL